MKTSKMNKAKAIFNQVATRKEFMEQALEQGLSKHCANTYYQNIKNEAKGESLYKYNKNVVKAEVKIEQEYQPVNRWLVVKEGKPVACFPSRQKAQDHAKLNGLKWKDASKI